MRDVKQQDRTDTAPRLRFDKVVTRLMTRLHATLDDAVPDGITVLLTVTAPIRLASKTAAELEARIQTLLRRGAPGRDARHTIHANRVRIRLVKNESARAPRLIGFVHNSDSDPVLLLNMTGELIEHITARSGRKAPKVPGDRRLVMMSARGVGCLDAYRYIYSQLHPPARFRKLLIVFGDGHVGRLTE